MPKKKPADLEPEEGEASLTADPKLHGIAAAALLLLGDLTGDQQIDVLRAIVKPGVTVLEPGNKVRETMAQAWQQAEDAVGAVDGSSGLGHLAAQNAANTIKRLRDTVRRAAQSLGVRPDW